MWGLKGIEVFLWYGCNAKCRFCFQKDLRLKETKFIKYDDVIKFIDIWISQWKNSIIFSWWEPSLDKNLINYIDYCKKNNFTDIRVHSNWINFSDKSILEKYVEAWVNWVVISVHWYWKIHDYLVWYKWAFERLKSTFVNLAKLKYDNPEFVIDTNTVLNRYNYNSLDILFRFLGKFPITRSQIVQLYSLYLFSLEEKKNYIFLMKSLLQK